MPASRGSSRGNCRSRSCSPPPPCRSPRYNAAAQSAFPAKAGIHLSTVSGSGEWVPAFAGNADYLSRFRKEPVFRARQAEVFAQRLALVFAAEQAAALQFRHDPVDEIVEPARHPREHDVEPVAGVAV